MSSAQVITFFIIIVLLMLNMLLAIIFATYDEIRNIGMSGAAVGCGMQTCPWAHLGIWIWFNFLYIRYQNLIFEFAVRPIVHAQGAKWALVARRLRRSGLRRPLADRESSLRISPATTRGHYFADLFADSWT